MVEKIGHIKNPLTVIAIFAGIAEISGTIVLPFIAPENQKIYIWFLMLFPFFLVGVFFYTLHSSPASLYSPSDYKDESNFANLIRRATPEEVSLKFSEEVKEVESDTIIEQTDEMPKVEKDVSEVPDSDQEPKISSSPQEKDKEKADERKSHSSGMTKHTRTLGDLALAEKLAINRLSFNLGIELHSNIHIDVSNGRSVTFDAIGFKGSTAHAVEVKLFATLTVDPKRFYSAIRQARQASEYFQNGNISQFVLHLFIVSDAEAKEIMDATSSLYSYAYTHKIRVSVHVAKMTDLANEIAS